MAREVTRVFHFDVEIDREDVLEALSDEDIRQECARRQLSAIDDAGQDIEQLARLIARGETEDALKLLQKLAPPYADLISPASLMRIEALHQKDMLNVQS
ncbi:hypothetical protein TM49_01735 [Martelella endophytica]|uniref:Uncharacterized protein n=2 Tax=Martelella endophytica TaxID=1486262 RepID=A0A0D5LKL1_MAREN|nr:hypothetical protein TM49_01735 [Martelella endophytica]